MIHLQAHRSNYFQFLQDVGGLWQRPCRRCSQRSLLPLRYPTRYWLFSNCEIRLDQGSSFYCSPVACSSSWINSGKEKNPHFVDQVAALYARDDRLIVVSYPCSVPCIMRISITNEQSIIQGCRSGIRSKLATADLLNAVLYILIHLHVYPLCISCNLESGSISLDQPAGLKNNVNVHSQGFKNVRNLDGGYLSLLRTTNQHLAAWYHNFFSDPLHQHYMEME